MVVLEFADGGHKGCAAERHAIRRLEPGESVCFVYGDESTAERKMRSLRVIMSEEGGWTRVVRFGRRVAAWHVGGKYRFALDETGTDCTKELTVLRSLLPGDSAEFAYETANCISAKKTSVKQKATESDIRVKIISRGKRLFVWVIERMGCVGCEK